MSRLGVDAELDKLAATLALERGTLAFLEGVQAEQLRALRVAVYELLHRDDALLFERLATLGARLPTRAKVALCQRFGPLVTARLAAQLPSAMALQVVTRLPTPFLADVCVNLDPRRTRDVLRAIPSEQIVALARELAARGDYMTMSRFGDFFPDEVIKAVVDAIEDEGALLRITFYMGSKNRLDHLLRLLPAERRERLIVRVEEEADELLLPFLSLLVHVSYPLKRELGDLAAAQQETVLSGFVLATQEQGLWPDLLPAVAAMSETARERVVNLPVLREPAVQADILRAADRHGLWGVTLPLVELMDEANREAVAGIVAEMPRETLAGAADAALMGEHWDTLLDLARRMPQSKRDELAGIVAGLGEVDPELADRIVRRAERYGLGEWAGASQTSLSRTGASSSSARS